MTRRDGCLLAFLAVAVLTWPLCDPGITTRGEAREAMIVRDMFRAGHWVLGYRLGVVASKPPFHHWLALGAAAILGPTATAARFPSALGAFVLAGMTLRLGAFLAGRHAGWLAVGALVGTLSFWQSALEARVDMVFAAVVTIALGEFLIWSLGDRRRAPLRCYLAVAAAILTKGPAGGVLPLAVVATFAIVRRDVRVLRDAWSWRAALPAGAIVLGWYALAYRAAGRTFVAVQLQRENVDRLVGRGGFAHHRERLLAHGKLLGAFVVQLFPWNLALLAAVRRRGQAISPAGTFLHLWWVVTLALFSIAAGKRAVYLLPLFPAVAALAGATLAQRFAGGRWWRATVATVVLLDVVCLGAVQADRRHTAHAHADFVRFATDIGGIVPANVRVHVSVAVEEDAYVTLGWLADRALVRAPEERCPPGGYLIAPAGVVATPPLARGSRRGRALGLWRCA